MSRKRNKSRRPCKLPSLLELARLGRVSPDRLDPFDRWKFDGNRTKDADHRYAAILRKWGITVDWSDGEPLDDETMERFYRNHRYRLPLLPGWRVAAHRRGQQNIRALGQRATYAKRHKQPIRLKVVGPDAVRFVEHINATYFASKLYYESSDDSFVSCYALLEMARPKTVRYWSSRANRDIHKRQMHKLEMLRSLLLAIGSRQGIYVDIDCEGQPDQTDLLRSTGGLVATIIHRGQHMLLPRCPQDTDVQRLARSRFSADALLAKLYEAVAHCDFARNREPNQWNAAYEFATNVRNVRKADLLNVYQHRMHGPIRFELARDLPYAEKLISARISPRYLDHLNKAEADKLKSCPIDYTILALGLLAYARGIYTVARRHRPWRANRLGDVPANSVLKMLHHFGFSSACGTHVRLIRETLGAAGLLQGNGKWGKNQCETFRLVGHALYLPFLFAYDPARRDRLQWEEEQRQRLEERQRARLAAIQARCTANAATRYAPTCFDPPASSWDEECLCLSLVPFYPSSHPSTVLSPSSMAQCSSSRSEFIT